MSGTSPLLPSKGISTEVPMVDQGEKREHFEFLNFRDKRQNASLNIFWLSRRKPRRIRQSLRSRRSRRGNALSFKHLVGLRRRLVSPDKFCIWGREWKRTISRRWLILRRMIVWNISTSWAIRGHACPVCEDFTGSRKGGSNETVQGPSNLWNSNSCT